MTINKVLLGVAIGIAIYLGISSFGLFTNIEGSGNLIKETRVLDDFHTIDAGSVFNIILTQGDIQKVEIETDDNLMANVITKVQKGELHISNDNNITNPTKLKVTITIPHLDEVDLSGASKIKSTGAIQGNAIEIECSGASEATLQLNFNKVELDFSGASKSQIRGNCKDLKIDASGASSIECGQMIADNVDVDVSGAAFVSFLAKKTINIEASGAANVVYKSENAKVNIETSGAADVKKK